MKVLVCGGREYTDRKRVFDELNKLDARKPITAIIHGAARGADTVAEKWANYRDRQNIPCPANWNIYGKAAGGIRNLEMLIQHKPDLVLAFPGGRGTADMVRRARAAGIPVMEFGS